MNKIEQKKDRFEEIKKEILKRARKAEACTKEYGKAYNSETMMQLCNVIKDNFGWCCRNDVLTVELLERYKDDFALYEIFVNTNCKTGYLLCDNATVEACGSATVEAWGSATVKAWGSATVEAWGNATVEAWGSATVKAWGNATVKAWGSATVEACGSATVEACGSAYCQSYFAIECKLSDSAIYRVESENVIYFVSENLKFIKQEIKDK